MKKIFVCLLFVILSTAAGSCGPAPIFLLEPWELKHVELPFDLWLEATGQWDLTFSGGEIQAVFSGQGDFQGRKTLSACFDGGVLGGGKFAIDVSIVLQGAQGILGLPLADKYWVMPLNTEKVALREEDGTSRPLANYEWQVLKAAETVTLAAAALKKPQVNKAAAASGAEAPEFGKVFRFRPAGLSLAPGELREIDVVFSGPRAAAKLFFAVPDGYYLSPAWSLGGRQLELEHCPARDQWFLSLPALGPGENVLRGSLQAAFPAETAAELAAFFKGEKAVLSLNSKKGWLGQDFLTSVKLVEAGKPAPGIPGLLPDGRTRSTDEKGRLVFPSDAFGPLLPGNDPKQLIWLGGALGTEREIKAEKTGPNYLLPIFMWDGGFSWRLLGSLKDVFFDTGRDGGSIRLRAGSLQLTGGRDVFKLSSAPAEYRHQDWYWREDHLRRLISLQKEDWRWELSLPKKQPEKPSFALHLEKRGLAAQVGSEDVELSWGTKRWRLGVRLKKRQAWAAFRRGALRLEIERGKIKARWQSPRLGRWQLSYNRQKMFHLKGGQGPWEVFAAREKGRWQAGFRFADAVYSTPPWHISLQGAVFTDRGLTLAEAGLGVGYRIADFWDLYLKNTWQLTAPAASGATLNHAYELGLVFRPASFGAAQLAWAKKGGLVLRLGVALPIIEK